MFLKIIFHIGSTANFLAIIYYMSINVVNSKRNQSFGGQWKFLTYWNLWFQLIYFISCLVNDLLGSEEKEKRKCSKVQSLRDYLFGAVGFPLGVFIGIIFWSIYLYNRELIFPKVLDTVFPPITNHMMHTAPLVCQGVEMFISYHHYPSKLAGMFGFGLVVLAYLSVICFIAYFGGFWVYPIFKVLTPASRVVFIALCVVMALGIYLFGEVINNSVWSPKKATKKIREHFDIPNHNYATRSKKRLGKAE